MGMRVLNLVQKKIHKVLKPGQHMDINFRRNLKNDAFFDNLNQQDEDRLGVLLPIAFGDLFLRVSK